MPLQQKEGKSHLTSSALPKPAKRRYLQLFRRTKKANDTITQATQSPVQSAIDVNTEKLKKRYESHQGCDFTIVSSDGVEFPVHSFELQADQTYFSILMRTKMKETTVDKQIKLDDINGKLLDVFLRYIYYKEYKESDTLDIDAFVDVIRLADKYEMTGLINKSFDYFKSKLDKNNIFDAINKINPIVTDTSVIIHPKITEMYKFAIEEIITQIKYYKNGMPGKCTTGKFGTSMTSCRHCCVHHHWSLPYSHVDGWKSNQITCIYDNLHLYYKSMYEKANFAYLVPERNPTVIAHECCEHSPERKEWYIDIDKVEDLPVDVLKIIIRKFAFTRPIY